MQHKQVRLRRRYLYMKTRMDVGTSPSIWARACSEASEGSIHIQIQIQIQIKFISKSNSNDNGDGGDDYDNGGNHDDDDDKQLVFCFSL